MPIFDLLCVDCGAMTESLITSSNDEQLCEKCGSVNVKRLLSAPANFQGKSMHRLPGQGDTACCGVTPTEANCAGPGSCCGKR